MATESKTKTTKAKGGGANAPRFHNQLYRAEVGRTPAGSPILKLTATNPTGRYAQHRQLAAFIYELAAEMERRSDDLGARWVISPDSRWVIGTGLPPPAGMRDIGARVEVT